ncbi:hypothetical protein AXX12_06830 [Anaerosporomusa subterranea]|uniref:Uncharacterized protein n=1 Tax=Anaerosporomusa subterranea TaxID=1794912 RepID=A0A154BQF4_ANASB|nr:hypothetical protein AXX12_06830 [Anaerosporomusa subterranea]
MCLTAKMPMLHAAKGVPAMLRLLSASVIARARRSSLAVCSKRLIYPRIYGRQPKEPDNCLATESKVSLPA